VRTLIVLVALLWTVAAAPAAQPQGEHAPPAAAEPHGQAAAGEHAAAGEGEHGGESPWALPARIFNFAILAGGLYYLLKSPLIGYLTQRGIHVRSELTSAATLRKDAAAQLAAVEAKMQALPGEIDALKRRGAEEIAAEEARIAGLAEAERQRLIEQAKREIEMQLRIAERDLKTRAAELAVEVATARVTRAITAADHQRLVDQYVEQVRH
jgi:F-type H+-transporting ATPase subunit b